MSTTEIDTLRTEVRAWRETVKPQADGRPTAPEGARLHALNMAWAEFKAAHEAKIQRQREAYEAERQELLAKIQAHNEAHPRRKRGRTPYGDYSPAVKLAAYRAFNGRNRTEIRTTLGAADTPTLDRVLREGRDLHNAGQAASDTDGGW